MPIELPGDSGRGRLSLLKLDLFLKGELEPGEMEEVRSKVESDPDAARYLREARELRSGLSWDELKAASDPRDEKTPKTRNARKARGGAPFIPARRPGYRPRRVLAALACAVLGMGLWVFLQESATSGNRAGPDVFASKGGRASFEARLEIDGRVVEPGDTAAVRRGASLRLEYRSMDSGYVHILFDDDKGGSPLAGFWKTIAFGPATRWNPMPMDSPPDLGNRTIRVRIISTREPASPVEIARIVGAAPNRDREDRDHVSAFILEAAPD